MLLFMQLILSLAALVAFVGGIYLGKSSGLWPSGEARSEGRSKLSVKQVGGLTQRSPWVPFSGSGAEMMRRAEAVADHRRGTYFVGRAIEEAGTAKLEQWAKELGGLAATRPYQPAALAEVVRRWGEADVAAALAWAQSLSGQLKGAVLPQVFRVLAAKDFPQARKMAEALSAAWERSGAILAIVEVHALTDAKEAFALWATLPKQWESFGVGKLFANWGRQDPAAAYLALAHITSKDARRVAQSSLFEVWSKRDPQAFLTTATKLPGQDGQVARNAAFNAWQQQDLEGALAWYGHLSPEERTKFSNAELLQHLAETDVSRATALAEHFTGQERLMALNSIADALAGTDFEAAVKWVYALPSLRDRKYALHGLVENVENAGPAATLASALQLPEGPERLEFVTQALIYIGSARSPFKATVLNGLPIEQATQILSQSDELLRSLCEADARAASTWVARLPTARINKYLNELGSCFAQQDAQAAYAWASGLPAEQQALALDGVLRNMAYENGAGAYAKALLMPDGPSREKTLQTALSAWMSQAPADAAAEQAMQQTTGETRRKLQDELASKKIEASPAEGAAFLLELLRSGKPEDADAAKWQSGTLGRRWAGSDPTAALVWLDQVPEGELRKKFLDEFAGEWTRQDPIAASAWIDHLPAGEIKDFATGKLVRSIHEIDPERAAVWAGQIQDMAKRESAYRDLFPDWLKSNFTSAQQALQSVNLPDDVKARWLKEAQAKQR